MTRVGRPHEDEEGWIEAGQPVRPLKEQIYERRRSVVGALALALLLVGVIIVAGPRLPVTTRLAPSSTSQGSSAWFQPLRYVTSATFFSATDGVVLTNLTSQSAGGLSPYAQSSLATHDGGRHWRDITPDAAGSVGCCTAFFLDPLHGWAVGNWAGLAGA